MDKKERKKKVEISELDTLTWLLWFSLKVEGSIGKERIGIWEALVE